MKKLFWLFSFGLIILFLSSPAAALVLLQENFTGATIADNKTINLLDNPGNTSNDNLGTWIDFPNTFRWGISDNGQNGSGDFFAQHLEQSPGSNTNILFYGFDLSVMPPLAEWTLEFDYARVPGEQEGSSRVQIWGMLNGQHKFEPYLPIVDGTDGIEIFNQSLGKTTGWVQDVSFSGLINQSFDALVLGFTFGGKDGFRGIDNIDFQANSVPEPSTLFLLCFGLFGIVGYGRRKS